MKAPLHFAERTRFSISFRWRIAATAGVLRHLVNHLVPIAAILRERAVA